MPFPESDRVRYRRNPIKSVICQLRFPTILKVETSLPADFQECIRAAYPHFQERPAPPSAQLPAELEGVIPGEVRQLFAQGGRHFDLTSIDRKKYITLNKDFLSLSTNDYGEWEEFIADLTGPLDALKRIYKPAQFARIGLRYHNLILRSEIDQKGASWSDLINPRLAGILADDLVAPYVDDCTQVATIRLKDGLGYVRIQHGLTIEENRKEQVYGIDSDFFIDQPTEVGNELDILGQLHRQAGRFFRWAIEPRLHDAMEPIPGSR
jgi:uncharacterized protein (TIGR04255 family)